MPHAMGGAIADFRSS